MKDSTRAKADVAKTVGLVTTMAVFAIVGAFLLPVAINEINADNTNTITQDESTTKDVNGALNTTLDTAYVSGATDNATFTLQQDDGTSIQKTIDNGTTATYSFSRGDVNVTVNDVTSTSSTAKYSYAKDFSYSDGASSLWGLLGLAIVLTMLLYMISQAMRGSKGI